MEISSAAGEVQLGALVVRRIDDAPADSAPTVTAANYQPPPPITNAPLAPLRSFSSEEGRRGELWSPPARPAEPSVPEATGAPLFNALSGQLRVTGGGGEFVLGGVSLRVFRDDGTFERTIKTAPDGTFESSGFARGLYRVEADRLELASRGARLESVRFEIGAGAATLQLVARPLADSALAMLQTAPSQQQNISVQAVSRPVLQARRAQAGVSGRIVLARSSQAGGLAGMELSILDRGGALVKAVTTGADGRFEAPDLPAGQYFVVAGARGAGSRPYRLEPVAPVDHDGVSVHDFGLIVARSM